MSATRRRILRIPPFTAAQQKVSVLPSALPAVASLLRANLSAEIIVQCCFDAPTGVTIVLLDANGTPRSFPLADPVDGVTLQQNKLYTLRFLADPMDTFDVQLESACNIVTMLVHEITGDIF